jgi:hypothetical protein
MAKRSAKPIRPVKTYNLYIWGNQKSDMPRRPRGKLVASFPRYKDLVAYAQRCAANAHYPISRWFDLYDWNQT